MGDSNKTMDLEIQVRHITEEQAKEIEHACAKAVSAVIGPHPKGTTYTVAPTISIRGEISPDWKVEAA